MIQKVVNLFPEWVAGFTRNQWQVYSGMGGSFEPESAISISWTFSAGLWVSRDAMVISTPVAL
jgi:hypothetical protein